MSIKKGDKIKVDYEGKFENGEVFDSSKHGDHAHPIEFEVGQGQVIKGFDEAVVGMEKGEEKKFEINPDEGYGEYREELKKDIPKDALPKEQEPKEGMMLMLSAPDGRQFPAKIEKVEEDKIIIDLNHPLAGKKLFFDIKIVDIEEGSETEKKEESGNNNSEESQ